MSNPPSDTNTIQFQMQPIVNGYPSVVDDAFIAALTTAKAGGDATWNYFNGINATSDFWGAIAGGTIGYVDGTDPQGRPVVMASTGNVDMRMLAVYAGDPSQAQAGDSTDMVLATLTVTTGNTTTQAAQMLALTARIASMPVYLPLSAKLFNSLLVPLYKNAKTLLSNMAENLQEGCQAEDPAIDPTAEAEETIEEQNAVIEEVPEELMEEGVDYLAISWSEVGLDLACMAPLVALPMLFEYLGHDMYHSLMIQNLTDLNFDWTLEAQVSGKPQLTPASSLVPACQTQTNLTGNGETTRFSFQVNFQFINSTNLSSIGYVMSLTPQGGGDPASLVFSIPWAGENTIWVGAGAATPQATYSQYSVPNGQLAMVAVFATYQVTVTMNKLQGETNGNYFYASLVVIEPLAP
jgi:hypothetical protein